MTGAAYSLGESFTWCRLHHDKAADVKKYRRGDSFGGVCVRKSRVV